MNQRNVDALMAAIIRAVEREDYVSIFPEHFRNPKGTDIERLAVRLVRMGVLVPSALTELEAWSVGDKGHDYGSDAHMTEIAVETVAALERIAKGED